MGKKGTGNRGYGTGDKGQGMGKNRTWNRRSGLRSGLTCPCIAGIHLELATSVSNYPPNWAVSTR